MISGCTILNPRQREHSSPAQKIVVPYHAGMKKTLTGGKVLRVVSELMGEPAVLYKEKINYKYPGGGGLRRHIRTRPLTSLSNSTSTCLISVDTATVESGCLSFVPGQYQPRFIRVG